MQRATAIGLPILILAGFSTGWIGARLATPHTPAPPPVVVVMAPTPTPVSIPKIAMMSAATVDVPLATEVASVAPANATRASVEFTSRGTMSQGVRFRGGGTPAPGRRHTATVVVDRRSHRLFLYQAGQIVRAFKVATGKHRNSTPSGTFHIISKTRNPDWTYKGQFVPGGTPENPLGHWWMGLSVTHRETGTRLGIHGTNTPWLIGKSVSRGCIRMRNRDAAALYRLVSAGTPVVIY